MIIESQEKLIRDYVAIATVKEIYFIKMNDIIFCKSEGRYTNFYLQNGKIELIYKPLKHFVDQLENKNIFYKPHRKYLINLNSTLYHFFSFLHRGQHNLLFGDVAYLPCLSHQLIL